MSEPYVLEYSKFLPTYPPTLIIEGMAQTGGLLVGRTFDFKRKVVLAKVGKSVFRGPALPGDELIIRIQIENLQQEGAMVSATCHRGDELLVEADVMFAYLDERFKDVTFFEDYRMACVLRGLRVFDVGKNKDGTPIEIPDHFLQAERLRVETGADD